jgi:hypothetical protein
VYSSDFKYPVRVIKYPFGLLPDSDSDRTADNQSIVLLSDTRGDRYPDHPFFIEPYLDKRKERKTALNRHHDEILGVFRKWETITICLNKSTGGPYETCIPLYADVVHPLQTIDRFGEGMSHLGGYTNAYNIISQIIRLQYRHNSSVSDFLCVEEKRITEAIWNNKDTSMISPWKSSHDIYPYYLLANIVEHFQAEVYKHVDLRIVPYQHYKGINYYKLFRREEAILAVAEEKDLRHLRELIDSEGMTVRNKFEDIMKNIELMTDLLHRFGQSVEKIVHYVPTYGLQGHCQIDRDLRVPFLWIRLIRFFRRLLLTNPSIYRVI